MRGTVIAMALCLIAYSLSLAGGFSAWAIHFWIHEQAALMRPHVTDIQMQDPEECTGDYLYPTYTDGTVYYVCVDDG